jgi:hypothetical protein
VLERLGQREGAVGAVRDVVVRFGDSSELDLQAEVIEARNRHAFLLFAVGVVLGVQAMITK